jgi:hypothetical protein
MVISALCSFIVCSVYMLLHANTSPHVEMLEFKFQLNIIHTVYLHTNEHTHQHENSRTYCVISHLFIKNELKALSRQVFLDFRLQPNLISMDCPHK